MVSVSAGGNVLATYTYTAGNGKLTRMTYGNGEYEDYTYDNLDRLVKVTYNGSAENAFTVVYDSNGRLAKAVDGKVGITYLYEYDSLDRLIRAYQKDANGNTTFAVENSYDEFGRATGSKYVIDGVSRTYSITYKENTNLVSSYTTPGAGFTYTYDNFDRLTSKYNPLNAYGYSYKAGTSLVSSLSVTTGIATPNYTDTTFDYTYNSLGYITSIKKNSNTIYNYEYDALGQLIREDDVVNSKAYVYAYDNAGNILKTYTFNTTGPNAQHWMDVYPALGEITETYTYSDSAWGDLLTNYNGTSISYDSIGNPTNWIGISSLTWDGRELDNITISNNHTVDYTYNSDGIRTRKYEFNGNEQYLYDHSYVLDGSTIVKETIQYSSAFNGNTLTTLEYYYDESGVNSFRYNGTVYHYIKNLQGDVIGIVNSNNGAIVVEYAYDAWGNILSTTGSLASTVGQINPFRYRGYYYDSETGLYYLNSRYYDAEVGRFINADSVMASVSTTLNGYNLFAYCFNNPVNMVDSDGNWPEWFKDTTKWIASNVVKPIVDCVQDILSEIDVTYSTGFGGTATDATSVMSGQIGTSLDTKGNICIQYTTSIGGTTGTPGFSITQYRSLTNAYCIEDLEGESYQMGFSGGVPIEGVPVVCGADLIIMEDSFSDKKYYGGSVSGGIGTPGFEVHTTTAETSSSKYINFNVFELFNKGYEIIMGW